jgi:hypothetical protein
LRAGFGVTQFTRIDMIGKEAGINAAIDSMRKLAKRGKLLTNEKYGVIAKDAFGDRANEIDAKLKNDIIDDDVISLAYWVLLEHQPVAESELPENALLYPAAGLFYQMKTWSIKQLNAFRSKTLDMARRGHKKQALKNLMLFTPLLIMSGAAPDALRDWLRGKEVDWEDLVIENLLKLVLLSRYLLIKDVAGMIGSQFAFTSTIESLRRDAKYFWRWFDWQANQDTMELPKDSPKYGVHSIRHIPVFGEGLYIGYPLLGLEGRRGRKKELEHVIDKYNKKEREGKTLSTSEEALRGRYEEWLIRIKEEEFKTFEKHMD